MQQELGELDPEWSLEQKAAYSALESEFELGGADEDVNLLPGEDDIHARKPCKSPKTRFRRRSALRMSRWKTPRCGN